MMYLPTKFKNENQTEILEMMAKYPFATVISPTPELPYISHLPLVIDRERQDMVLVGHLARMNPHWKHLEGAPVTAIFHGPNTYITPQWYVENDVPTWNYAVVHVRGRVELIEENEGIIDCVKKLTTEMEAGEKDPWAFWIPEDLSDLGTAIVGFRIVVEELSAKFKLSQNRSEEDRKGVIKGLEEKGDEMSFRTAVMMKTHLDLKTGA